MVISSTQNPCGHTSHKANMITEEGSIQNPLGAINDRMVTAKPHIYIW